LSEIAQEPAQGKGGLDWTNRLGAASHGSLCEVFRGGDVLIALQSLSNGDGDFATRFTRGQKQGEAREL
jgi:hypothetical protein